MLTQFIFQAQEFEANILRHVFDDKEESFLANVNDFEEGRYFIKTEFHKKFVEAIEDNRAKKTTLIYLNGIEGLGKTSSAIYYILKCRENDDLSVHYVDVNEIEKRDEDLEFFIAHSKKFKDNDCIIVDHLTLYNTHYLNKMKKIVERQVKRPKFILIETGFTASAHKFTEFGRKFQLDEDSFVDIWKGSLEYLIAKKDREDESYDHRLSLKEKGKEVYNEFSKEYIMTPRLLNSVLEDMYTRTDGTVDDAFAQFTKEKQHKIANCKSCESPEYSRFQLHTAVLLNFIPNKREIIMKWEEAQEFSIGINIFEVQYYRVQAEDLQSNLEYARMDLDVGDRCVKIRHLIPNLANCWRRRFPYHLEEMIHNAKISSDKMLQIMFQNGGARKEFEKLFVESQKKQGVLLPERGGNTLYQPSQTKQEVSQSSWKMKYIPAKNFVECYTKDLSLHYQDVPNNLKGHERNVALFSLFIKHYAKSYDRFLVYPKIPNFMGIDYFVYYTDSDEKEGCSSPKRVKVEEKTLYLVQVATGAMHRGDTIGQALNVVKQIFVNENVAVHVVVVVASKNQESFTLTKCAFQKISVLDLGETEELLLQQNSLLHQFYLELVRSSEAEHV